MVWICKMTEKDWFEEKEDEEKVGEEEEGRMNGQWRNRFIILASKNIWANIHECFGAKFLFVCEEEKQKGEKDRWDVQLESSLEGAMKKQRWCPQGTNLGTETMNRKYFS